MNWTKFQDTTRVSENITEASNDCDEIGHRKHSSLSARGRVWGELDAYNTDVNYYQWIQMQSQIGLCSKLSLAKYIHHIV